MREIFVSIFGNVFKGEPTPENGRMQPRDLPGWGVELDHSLVRLSSANEQQP